jgi:AcrR family transcriptional regulator
MALREVKTSPTAKQAAPQALSRRARQRQETRERLFQVALEEFRSVGVADAQIDRIVERAGVSRGTFYFHFPTKDHVLLELRRRGEQDVLARMEQLGAPPESPREFLTRVYLAIASSLAVEAPLRREVIAMYLRQPQVRPDLASEPLIVALVDYIADAAERGLLRDDIPPEALAVQFLASVTLHLLGDLDDAASDGAQLAIQLFLEGATRR